MPFAVAFVALRAVRSGCDTHSPRDIRVGQDRKGNMSYKTKNPNWFGIGMDAWALAAESNMVIAQRLGAMAFGGPAAAKEAERMVSEKVAANMALGFDLMTGKLGSSPEQIMSGSIEHYSRRVRSNRRRLEK
jgi:hypothetical protein